MLVPPQQTKYEMEKDVFRVVESGLNAVIDSTTTNIRLDFEKAVK